MAQHLARSLPTTGGIDAILNFCTLKAWKVVSFTILDKYTMMIFGMSLKVYTSVCVCNQTHTHIDLLLIQKFLLEWILYLK